jgi:type IV secretory pathway TraG/TraD family ATPase VirD4
MLQMPWQSTIIIFTITLIPCIFSSVFIGYENLNGGFMSTLSNHRMYFIIFPIYIFVAIFFSFIINNFSKYYSKQLAIIFSIIIFLYSISYINKQNQIFDALVISNNDKLNGDNSYLQWLDGEINYDRDMKNASHGEAPWIATKPNGVIDYNLAYYRNKYGEMAKM